MSPPRAAAPLLPDAVHPARVFICWIIPRIRHAARLGGKLILTCAGRGEEASLQIDLKGALYNAALAPSACTLAVINLGPSEARVEMLASHFLQLDRVQGLGDVEGGDLHLWQDEDQEQVC